MPSRVLLDSLAGVEHEQRRFGARRTRDHVLEELDVARRVENQVAALRRAEEHARGVDGDSLRALVLERIQQERVFERLGRAGAQILDLLEPAFRQCSRVREQASDDRALAMIDVTDDHDPHPRLYFGRIVDALECILLDLDVERKSFLVEANRPRKCRARCDAHTAASVPRCTTAGWVMPLSTSCDSMTRSGASDADTEQ